MPYTRQELFSIAHDLGHANPTVYETRSGKFFATCSCGYISTSTMRFVNALQQGVNHALSAAVVVTRDSEAKGIVLTPEVVAEYARRQRPSRAARTVIPEDAELVAWS